MEFRNSFQRSSSPIVLNLIIINALAYFAQIAFGGNTNDSHITDLFALHHYRSDTFYPFQLITHMFMHGSIFHLLFNMLALFMFGTMIEQIMGSKKFLIFYLICGLFAGLAQMGNYVVDFWNIDQHLQSYDLETYQQLLRSNATVGASGAIMGIVAAYGYCFPNTKMIIMPIPFPIKAKWAITGIILLDVFGGISNTTGDNIAHFAHVGGALIGLILIFFWKRKNRNIFY